MTRTPAVAGRFYPEDPEELARQIAAFSSQTEKTRRVISCMVPHAGYKYSGAIAGAVYSRISFPKRILLLGPRHFPRGKPQAIMSEGAWLTPLGRAEIDAELASELKHAHPALIEDEVAHQAEHSLEVQLPFLQALIGAFQFVPIVLGVTNLDELEALGRSIAAVLRRMPESVLMVASSDMNHYEDDELTRRKDHLALERILALDARGLYDTIRSANISMCGMGPVISVLTASRLLGATRADLVLYGTSGDVNGDRNEVVGYAGVLVE